MFSDRTPSVDPDAVFDDQLPNKIQLKADVHFTPVAVARHAATLLAPRPGMKVLDVGAGAGKFCVVAACQAPQGTFVGVELRPHLVRLARRLAKRFSIRNVEFLDGDAFDLDWSAYDSFYFYNPFAEQLHNTAFVLDRTLDLAPSRFLEYVMAVRQRLIAAPLGTRVVTYHGFGAPPPFGYELAEKHVMGTDYLELWIKARDLFGIETRLADSAEL